MIQTENKPYYDDFDVTKGFIKVLFKPELSVQTRELNQMQSILQNQIGNLADTIYKDGSVVKDGRLTFKNDIDYAKFDTIYNSVTFNYDTFKERKIYGTTTELVASVFDGFNYNNDSKPSTLYLNYLNSGINQEKTFQENEVVNIVNEIFVTQTSGSFNINETIIGSDHGAQAKLIMIDNSKFSIVYLNNNRFVEGEVITGQTSSATCVYSNGETVQHQIKVANNTTFVDPIGKGSFVLLGSGTYYIDGYFVNVSKQQLLLSEYDTVVSAKVGFNKEVEYIEAADDNSLYDNANGTPNENAPGADRLKLYLKLCYYNIFDNEPEQFIEIMRINQSNIVFNNSENSQWSNIIDLLAKRTYDESGNYTVNPFIVDIQEFLDENNNNGIYKETYFGFNSQVEAQNASIEVFGETTGVSHLYNYKYYPLANHTTFLQACRDRVCLGINPGLAYVLGYEVDLTSRIYVPMLKARELGTDKNSIVNVKFGNYCIVDTVEGIPNINKYINVNLSSDTTYAGSNIIGTAKVRLLQKRSSTEYKLYLTDVNMSTGYYFSSVKSLGAGTSTNDFKCELVESKLYDLDRDILLFSLPQTSVKRLNDASYNYEMYNTGQSDNTGTITVTLSSGSSFYSFNASDYILTMTTGAAAGQIIDVTGKIAVTGSTVVITLGSDAQYVSQSYTLIAPVNKSSGSLKTKTLVTNAEFNISSPSDTITITGAADGYRLVAVYMSANMSTPATTSDTNVTSNYTFDNGQRDNYYDFVRVKRIPNTSTPTGQLLVVIDYFTHSSGDYFTSESYESTIDYADIPSYTSSNSTIYNLRDCIDFRPRMGLDGSSQPTLDNIINPCILVPDSNFLSDTEYYLPRIDLLEVDYLGNFKIKKGTSSNNPQTPSGDLNAMVLYNFVIPSYTSEINNIVKNYNENKRYTMRDIGQLDTRIYAIESYILLTQNEYDVSNMPITGLDGTSRYKTGYIADNFTDHSYGDFTSSYYKCAVDVTNNLSRPSYKLNTLQLEQDTTGSNTVVNVNGKYMIPYTNTDSMSQTVGTSLMRINENGLVSWEGNLLITPSVNNNFNNIDQSKQNFGDDIDYLSEYNAILADSSNSLEYGNFFLNWLGVK